MTDADYLVDNSTPDREDSFVMDSLGNRTGDQTLSDETVNFTVQASTNRYTSIGGSSISHDDAGNLTVDKDGYKCFYDYENRVVKIQKPDGSGGWDDVAEMAYDALGRRIRMIDKAAEPDVPTLYYYNPDWQCLAEYNGAGALQRYFVYGNYIDEPLVMNDGTDDYYYAHDHLYSTVVLLDDSGSIVERYEYDAYGTVLVYTDDGNDGTWFTGDDTTANASARSNPYTFTSRQLDTLDNGNLQRMHYRHRDYSPQLGRFMQHDPLGMNPHASIGNYFSIVVLQYSDGCNLYQYVRSMPATGTDPLGLLDPIFFPGLYPTPAVPRSVPLICDGYKIKPRMACKSACATAGATCIWACGYIPEPRASLACRIICANVAFRCMELCNALPESIP